MTTNLTEAGSPASAGGTEAGEFLLTERDFERIAAIVHAEAGIVLQNNKMNLVYSRLAKRLRKLGLRSFKEYCALVANPEEHEERGAMIRALTTNVTRFFREPHHFDHLKTALIPAWRNNAVQGGRVRVWSAGCSSGQEPYSIALALLSIFPDAASHDVKILATDIDENMIEKGQSGIFDRSVMSDVPQDLRQRWFKPLEGRDGAMQAGEALRTLVTFKKLNLIGAWPMKNRFDAVFCRNVVIYFDAETQATLWSRIVPLLTPGGALYIGHSERVAGPAESLLVSDGITTYRPLGWRRS
ncbi:MAG TPA: protein-glutamate O-methyltransferase CheR [Acidocella sp.]|nr:MAG: chemotaxis protein [Rhodospirillales bacterium 20-64-7]HQT46775.1 protein-glutamate O-methyltransferase CheR [Acidocella sp.]